MRSECISQKRLLESIEITTPAYVFDLEVVRSAASLNARVCQSAGAKLLYAMKACDARDVVAELTPYVDGFSCSSIREIEISRSCASARQRTHWISPLIMPEESARAFTLCDQVTLNSLTQLLTLDGWVRSHGNIGLRVNPGLSMVRDDRYNPAAKGSRLGVWRDVVVQAHENGGESVLANVRGLHFHTNCDSTDSGGLAEASYQVVNDFGDLFDDIHWVNIGGGYLPSKWGSEDGLRRAVDMIRECWSCEVCFEPGADLVRDAGYLVATVGDIVPTPTGSVAILDTTVNHWPEVFEYAFEPDVLGHVDEGQYWYTLAGRSCLAGDIFGEYCFASPLNAGDRVVFTGAGAYSLVKAHRFNGLPLPLVYCLINGECVSDQELSSSYTNIG